MIIDFTFRQTKFECASIVVMYLSKFFKRLTKLSQLCICLPISRFNLVLYQRRFTWQFQQFCIHTNSNTKYVYDVVYNFSLYSPFTIINVRKRSETDALRIPHEYYSSKRNGKQVRILWTIFPNQKRIRWTIKDSSFIRGLWVSNQIRSSSLISFSTSFLVHSG